MIDFISSQPILGNISITLLWAILVLVVRKITLRQILSSKAMLPEVRLQWAVGLRSVFLLILLGGAVAIWASELKSFALSVVAIATAVIIGLRELIANVSGYFTRVGSHLFNIGDRIEVAGIRGDVIDQNFFVTRLLEIGPGTLTNQYTGRSIAIPNSVYLTQNVINESFTKKYTLHVFSIPVCINAHWMEMEESLLRIAKQVCSEFMLEAEKQFENFGARQGLEPPSVEPRVLIKVDQPEMIHFVLRIPVPIGRKGRIEQEIIKQFLTLHALDLATKNEG